MNRADVEKLIRGWVDLTNTRRAEVKEEDLDPFLPETLVFKGQTITRAQMLEQMQMAFKLFDSFSIKVNRLVVDPEIQEAAARFVFEDVKPKAATGQAEGEKTITFSEMSFFKFEQGKIVSIVNLLDHKVLEGQA